MRKHIREREAAKEQEALEKEEAEKAEKTVTASELRKMALDIQKMKKNLDDAPDRPQKFPTHGGLEGDVEKYLAAREVRTGYKKTAGLDKEAIGAMGALMGAMVLPEHARQAKNNLAATRGTQGAVMTPAQVQQRKAQMGMF